VQRNVTATFDLGDKLIQAKDMQDVARFGLTGNYCLAMTRKYNSRFDRK